MILEDFGLPLAYEAAFFMQSLEDPSLPVAEMGELSLVICQKLRSLAIMALVSKGDPALFGQNLTRSGRVRLAYLRRLRREGVENDHHSASGRIDGLMDALTASDLELALEIVKVSRTLWLEGAEYEDDFRYAQMIHGLVSRDMTEAASGSIIEQYEKTLDGQPSARLDVCRALWNRDQEAFDGAFDNLIQEQEAKIAADKARFQLEEPEVMAHRLIFVEGLAVLRLATLHGLKTEPDYFFCPSIARLIEAFPVPEE
jgi:Immunity protein 49